MGLMGWGLVVQEVHGTFLPHPPTRACSLGSWGPNIMPNKNPIRTSSGLALKFCMTRMDCERDEQRDGQMNKPGGGQIMNKGTDSR